MLAASLCGALLGLVRLSGAEVTVKVQGSDVAGGTMILTGAGLPGAGADGKQTVAVGPGDAAIGYAGQSVSGDLHQSSGTWRFDNIWPADPALIAVTDEATRRLKYDLVEQGRKAYRDVGDTLPAFALYDQNGKLVRTQALIGRPLVIDFIFTRCAQADMCPASTQKMAQLQKALKKANRTDVLLVTITLDPAYDTPGILRQYAQAYGLDLANFALLTGPPEEMSPLLEEFGILRRTQDGILQHTISTIVVSPQGRITYRNPGNLWTAEEIMARLPANAANAPAKAG
jgi:protein SCO1/2